MIIDNQVQREPVEPAQRRLATCGTSSKHPVLMNAGVVTDGQRGRVNEADARTAAQLGVQIGHQRNQQRGHQLDEALIAELDGKLSTQVALDVLAVIGLERSVVGLMEQDHDGHHFARMHLRRAQALSLTRCQQGVVPGGRKLLPEIVYGTKQFEYTHHGTSWG